MSEVAVVGGGLYGITVAERLDREGHDVELYEARPVLFDGASMHNQQRLHKGYHYPRSKQTAMQCLDSLNGFRELYGDAVISSTDHYYCISEEGSKTGPGEYKEFMDDVGLVYESEYPRSIDPNKVSLSVTVPENRIDLHVLRGEAMGLIKDSDVEVKLSNPVYDVTDLDHDYKIVATYAGINLPFPEGHELRRDYKYQIVEKPVVETPVQMTSESVVVLDGPFMCHDPYGKTGRSLLGHVVHTIHDEYIGEDPTFSEHLLDLVSSGLVDPPEGFSNFDLITNSSSEYFPPIANCNHIGSFYTIRTVMSGVEDTDERLAHVDRHGDTFRVFSGKLSSCVLAAEEAVESIDP